MKNPIESVFLRFQNRPTTNPSIVRACSATDIDCERIVSYRPRERERNDQESGIWGIGVAGFPRINAGMQDGSCECKSTWPGWVKQSHLYIGTTRAVTNAENLSK